MANNTNKKDKKISQEEKDLRELEDNYSLYDDWTPLTRGVAWAAVIVFLVAVYIVMNSGIFEYTAN